MGIFPRSVKVSTNLYEEDVDFSPVKFLQNYELKSISVRNRGNPT